MTRQLIEEQNVREAFEKAAEAYGEFGDLRSAEIVIAERDAFLSGGSLSSIETEKDRQFLLNYSARRRTMKAVGSEGGH